MKKQTFITVLLAKLSLKLKSRGQGTEQIKTMTKVKINNVEAELSDDQLKELLSAMPKNKLEEALKLKTPITERVKTFEDALVLAKVSPEILEFISYRTNNKQILATQAHAKLAIIAEALNEGWKPDWSNSKEYKYWPWLKFTPGVGFSFGDCDHVTRLRLSARAFALNRVS